MFVSDCRGVGKILIEKCLNSKKVNFDFCVSLVDKMYYSMIEKMIIEKQVIVRLLYHKNKCAVRYWNA